MAHLIPNQRARGFGSILTERSIVGQFGGKIEYDWQQSGPQAEDNGSIGSTFGLKLVR